MAEGRRAHDLRRAPTRHPLWWAMSAVTAILAAMLVHLLATNANLHWDVVRKYFLSQEILLGLLRTLELTLIAMAFGIALGSLIAVLRLSKNPVVSGASWAYVWFFRGTPLLVQIIFWFNLSLLLHRVSLGIPFGPSFVSGDTNTMITPFTAAVLALSLNEAAYMSEIVRAGILSVDFGQSEAALSIGMTRIQTIRWIIYPQAMKVVIPPTGNQTIGMLKTSSLVSVIAFPELLYASELIYARTYQTVPLLITASLWYIIVSTVLTCAQYYVERYYARGSSRQLPPTPVQRLTGRVRALLGTQAGGRVA